MLNPRSVGMTYQVKVNCPWFLEPGQQSGRGQPGKAHRVGLKVERSEINHNVDYKSLDVQEILDRFNGSVWMVP